MAAQVERGTATAGGRSFRSNYEDSPLGNIGRVILRGSISNVLKTLGIAKVEPEHVR